MKFTVERSAAEFLLQLFVERIGDSCNLFESCSGMFFYLRKPEQVHGGDHRIAGQEPLWDERCGVQEIEFFEDCSARCHLNEHRSKDANG